MCQQPSTMDPMNYFNNLSGDAKTEFLAASLNMDGDKYDDLGRNTSAQLRRQKLIPWVLVDRQRHPVEDPPSVRRAWAERAPRLVTD